MPFLLLLLFQSPARSLKLGLSFIAPMNSLPGPRQPAVAAPLSGLLEWPVTVTQG